MGKMINKYWSRQKHYSKLASDNEKAISEYNKKMLLTLTKIGGFLMLLPVLAIPFSPSKHAAVPAYLMSSLIFLPYILYSGCLL
ncbi:MAG: hypothetical protein WCX81_04585 [Monoglobales bacterium]